MNNILRPVLVVFTALTLATGIVYPLLVTGMAQVLFRSAASGSIVERNGRAIGSALLGQPFSSPRYFWGRPSATGPQPYNGGASTGSNQAATNPALAAAVSSRVAALRAADLGNTAPVPVDLVTAAGSGLDPHISLAGAEYQVARVARVRGLDEARVRSVIQAVAEGRTFGILGEPRVNVLALNLALDALR